MRRRRLTETYEMSLVVEPNIDIVVDNMVAEWGGSPLPELAVFLVFLRYLALVHQTHHWVSKGGTFYGDHLLFERLYDGVSGEIDSIAEKIVGLGHESSVDLPLQVKQVDKLVAGSNRTSTIPRPSELARQSFVAEMSFLKAASRLTQTLKERGLLTRGLDNLLAGIEDKHEGHVYLLKQRISEGA